MPEKTILTLDSQILNSIQLCERRTKYAFIDNIAPSERGEAIERGDLMHKMLEIYESLRSQCLNLNSDTWKEIKEAGIPMTPFPVGRENSRTSIMQYAILCGRMFAAKMELPAEEIEMVIYQFQEYTDYYKNDSWKTLAVEEVGSKILFEDEALKIIYVFKIDRLAEGERGIIAPFDYKTSKRRSDTHSISNQFMGYAWATDSNYVVVDKIGFQKTLKRDERFQRILLSYDQERINEWVANSVASAFDYLRVLQSPDITKMNLTSCDKYSGCIYRPICEHAASGRQWIIDRNYMIREQWDPAKSLESKESD